MGAESRLMRPYMVIRGHSRTFSANSLSSSLNTGATLNTMGEGVAVESEPRGLADENGVGLREVTWLGDVAW
jgi:hypothetical protein